MPRPGIHSWFTLNTRVNSADHQAEATLRWISLVLMTRASHRSSQNGQDFRIWRKEEEHLLRQQHRECVVLTICPEQSWGF
jgi:hypothetical protein